MTPEQYQRVIDIFHAALQRTQDLRAAFLTKACAGDAKLRRAIEEMLAADKRATHFLEESPADIAADALMACKDEALIGRSLGEYLVIARLGTGGMGDVFLANDSRLRRKVALKFLSRELASDRVGLRRFEKEACAVSALNHPNIVTVYGLGQSDELSFIATEFVEGQTLRELMNQGPLAAETVINIGSQVAQALDAAHAHGIVHRDIKPENIMLRPDGLVKVLDFGVAKWTGAESSADGLRAAEPAQTTQGVIVGTPRYMSPEQARGQHVDNRSDLFSLGAVLYEMLSGHAAMAGETPSDIIASILLRDPEPLATIRPGCPRSLIRVISRALKKDRECRYSSAGDLLADLKSIAAKPDQIRAQSPQRSRWYLLGVAATCLSVLLAAILLVRAHSAGAILDSIAVLPLRNNGGADLEFLADGLTDSLIGDLSEIPNLKVSPHSSVFQFRDRRRAPALIGKLLKTRTVLSARLYPFQAA